MGAADTCGGRSKFFHFNAVFGKNFLPLLHLGLAPPHRLGNRKIVCGSKWGVRDTRPLRGSKFFHFNAVFGKILPFPFIWSWRPLTVWEIIKLSADPSGGGRDARALPSVQILSFYFNAVFWKNVAK